MSDNGSSSTCVNALKYTIPYPNIGDSHQMSSVFNKKKWVAFQALLFSNSLQIIEPTRHMESRTQFP